MKTRIDKARRSVKEFLTDFFHALRKNEMVILPGNLAFYFVLAIMPTLSMLSLGASILNLSTDVISNFLTNSFSKEMADLILGIHLEEFFGLEFILTIIISVYVSTNGADAIILASNTIYNVPNNSWIKRRIKALGMTFLISLLILFMLIVPVFGETIITLIEEVNLNSVLTSKIVSAFHLIQGPVTWLIMFVIIKMLYKIAPDERKKGRVTTYGAIFTTIMFLVVTKVYSLYVANYASYQALYGGLANIIVLMIWLYMLSLIFTIGIALNVEKDNNLLKNTKHNK